MTRPIAVALVEAVEMSEPEPGTAPVGTRRPETACADAFRKMGESSKTGSTVDEEKGRQKRHASATVPPAAPEGKESAESGKSREGDDGEGESPPDDEDEGEPSDSDTWYAGSVGVPPRPIRKADEFMSAKREKLTYRIVMYGIPVGSAVLEAVNDGNEVRISSTVSSNEAVSGIYPVSDYAETRLMGGVYIINRVRQKEGNFTSDTGFTLGLKEKTIFWVDRLHNRFATHPLPREDVLDILSGLYYIRNQRLEIGKSVLLHLFDSNRYAATTVAVLRREHVSLPGFRAVDALVVHPLVKTEGIFTRTGDLLLWLSDDENRVPVRLETTVPLGRVRAELVSAEVERN